MRTLVVFVAVLVSACSGGGTKPVADPAMPPTASMLDCGKVADHVATTVVAGKPRPGATHATVKELVSTRCQADKWNDETKQCLNDIKTVAEGRACASKMTDEQRAAIKMAARSLRTKETSPPPDDPASNWIEHVVEDGPDDGHPR